MNKLKAILLVCVAAGIAGCFRDCCDDCTYNEDKLSVYANESGEMVKIIVIDKYYPNYEESIANGDIFYNYSIEELRVFLPIGCDLPYCFDKPIRVELHFLDDSQKCLIFDGPIKNDRIDMRSWDSYEKGNAIDGWGDGWSVGVEYIYTITKEHRDMAKKEDCLK